MTSYRTTVTLPKSLKEVVENRMKKQGYTALSEYLQQLVREGLVAGGYLEPKNVINTPSSPSHRKNVRSKGFPK